MSAWGKSWGYTWKTSWGPLERVVRRIKAFAKMPAKYLVFPRFK